MSITATLTNTPIGDARSITVAESRDTIITVDTTLTNADSGKTIICNAVDLTVTLPTSTDAGWHVTIISNVPSAGTGLTVAGDINGGTTSAVNSGATDAIGDSIELHHLGSDAFVGRLTGTWAVS